MTQSEQDMERLKKCVEALGEHFDAVQIFASRHEPTIEDGTVRINIGIGNWYTRYGQVMEWVTEQDERAREKVRMETEDE